MRNLVVSLAIVVCGCASGCSTSSTTSSPDAGTPDAGGCTGEGSVIVNVSGDLLAPPLFSGVKIGDRNVSGLGSGEVKVPAGEYPVTAENLILPGTPVREVYVPNLSATSVRACSEAAVSVTVTYKKIPTSGHLWMSNANGASNVVGFSLKGLPVSATISATYTPKTIGSKGIAFDKDGNLWTIGATTADPILVRYSAASLVQTDPTPDRKIDVANNGCSPLASALAFDSTGNLWVSSPCQKKVVRVERSQLGADGNVTPTVEITGFDSPNGFAFDSNNSLWVADSGAAKALRFDGATLAASTTVASAITTLSTTENAVDYLAFDASGNLWVVGGSQVNLTQIAKADLATPGASTPTAVSTISVGVASLPEGIAFDEGGGLWIGTSAGKFARLAPSQLGTSSTFAAPTVPDRVYSSTAIGSAGSIAIFPAPAALPIYHRLP